MCGQPICFPFTRYNETQDQALVTVPVKTSQGLLWLARLTVLPASPPKTIDASLHGNRFIWWGRGKVRGGVQESAYLGGYHCVYKPRTSPQNIEQGTSNVKWRRQNDGLSDV